MKKVLVCCAAGITTSMLVAKLKTAAEARGMDIDIEARPLNKAVSDFSDADVVLLGPQVAYAAEGFVDAGAKQVATIDSDRYARQDVDGILDCLEKYL